MTAIYDINGNSVNPDDYLTDVAITCRLDVLINLFSDSNEKIFLTNRDGEIIYANDKFLQLYGYNGEEILNLTPSIFGVTGNSEIIYNEVSRSNFADKWNGKLLSMKSSGAVIVIELNAVKLLDEDGNVYATLWITRDITHSQNINPAIKSVTNKSRSVKL